MLGPKQGRSITARPLATIATVAVAVFVFGFVLFAANVSRIDRRPMPVADAIVVLTGGEQRLEEAVQLLRQGRGRRLLISGVNPINGKSDIRRLTGGSANLFDCCIDLGYTARNTIGNAEETRDWARTWKFQRLIIVTSSYHMPRSLIELSRMMPGTALIPFPVTPRSLASEPWWLSPTSARTLIAEYLKFLPSAVVHGAWRIIHPDENALDIPTSPLSRATAG
jgi:uncharacterized SAM-binding protein YcdF (DUF218 family)